MNIPEGFVLPDDEIVLAAEEAYSIMFEAAPPVELPAYDEAAELAACRAHWEKNPNCLFSDMWLGWKACAQSRDGSVSDE